MQRTPYDTLVSASTGQEYLVDSVHGSTYFISTKAERIGLDVSMVWSYIGRWSLYAGVGVMGGPSVNARTYVQLENYEGIAQPKVLPPIIRKEVTGRAPMKR